VDFHVADHVVCAETAVRLELAAKVRSAASSSMPAMAGSARFADVAMSEWPQSIEASVLALGLSPP
jgi:hypothetical protein